MKVSAKQKKWIKHIGLLIALRLLLGVVVYYTIVYRFRDIIQIALNIETKSAYQFDVGDIDVQLFRGKIKMKNAFLHFRDSSREVTYHDIKIPQVQIEIESFRELIFHGKLNIKDLSIIRPALATRAVENHDPRHVTLHASHIVKALKKMTRHLNVQRLTLEDGEFSYKTSDTGRAITGSNISVSLRDFSGENLHEKKYIEKGELSIRIKNQHWIMPDGKHEIGFKSLLLSVEKDILDIDSLTVSIKKGDTSVLRFFADRIIMKSGAILPSLEENAIAIDSVMVVHPVLNAGSQQYSKTKEIRNADSIRYFLDNIKIKYLDIVEGQVEFTGNSGNLISTDRANVQVFNLNLDTRGDHKITTDSIALSLQDIQFYSRDSLFKLNVGHCGFSGEHLNFEDVSFGPSEKNKNFNGLVFKAPAIKLKNIDAGDLIRKKITATEALLLRPDITYIRKKNQDADTATTLSTSDHTTMLQNLHNIIDVPEFRMEDGHLSIFSEKRPKERITADHMYATVLLNELTGSESRQEMKSAVTMWIARSLKIVLPSLEMDVNGLSFNGKEQHSHFESVDLRFENGTTFRGEDLYMDRLNLDHLFIDKKIDLGKTKIMQARLRVHKDDNKTGSPSGKKQVPFHLGVVEVDHLLFESENADGKFLTLTGSNLGMTDLTHDDGKFAWKKINGLLTDIRQKSSKGEMTVESVKVENELIKLTNLKLRTATGDNGEKIDIPSITISAPVFPKGKTAHIDAIHITSPQLVLIKTENTPKKNNPVPFNLPQGLIVKNAYISDADIQYLDYSKKDSVSLNLKASVQASGFDLSEGKSSSIRFKSLKVIGSQAEFIKAGFIAQIPEFSMNLSDGKIAETTGGKRKIETAVEGRWENLSVGYIKNDHRVSAKSVSGNYVNQRFIWNPDEKPNLAEQANHVSFQASDVLYQYNTSTVRVSAITWNERNNRSLNLLDFSLLPEESWEEWLKKTEWQKDYLTMKGKSLNIAGVSFKQAPGDSLLEIGKITADEIVLTTLKDKRKPFRHGIDKGMPTELVERIKFPVLIDTIQVKNSAILVSQISDKTSKEGLIPVRSLNAIITGISNQENNQTLKIAASAEIYDNYIRSVEYSENYEGEAGFTFTARISPMTLPTFNPIIVPLANIAIKNGNADTLVATWKGNKYAAVGRMDFYYDGLKVNFLNKKNPEKHNLRTRTLSGLTNLIIRNGNQRTSYMILSERDSEKFFVTYWVKSLLSGMLTTAGLKTNKKYRKIYHKNKLNWQLNYPEYL